MKEQIQKLGKGTLVYGVGQVLTKLIHFLMLPLFTTYLSPGDYGVISILTVFSFLAAPIFGLGVSNSIGIVYFEHELANQKQQTIWTSFLILAASSVLFIAVSFFYSGAISQLAFQSDQYDGLIRMVAIGTVFNGIVNQPFIFRLQFEQRSKRFVLVSFAATLVTICLTVWFVVVLRRGVEGFILATLIGNVFTFFVYFFSVVGWTRFSTDWLTAQKLLRLGYPMIPSIIFVFLIQNSGRYMLQIFLGVGEVGIYTVGYNFGMAISIAVTAFTTAWFPHFSSFVNRQEEAESTFGRILLYYIFALGSLCLMFFIFSKPVVGLMTQPPFYEAHAVVGLIAAGNVFVGAFSILSAGAYFAKKVYLVNLAQAIAAIFCLVLNYLLIPVLGIVGAAVSFLISNFVIVLFQYFLNRRMKLLRVTYDGKRIWYFVLTAVLVVVLCFVPRDFSLKLELLTSMVLFGGLFVVLYAQLTSGEKRTIGQMFWSAAGLFKRL